MLIGALREFALRLPLSIVYVGRTSHSLAEGQWLNVAWGNAPGIECDDLGLAEGQIQDETGWMRIASRKRRRKKRMLTRFYAVGTDQSPC